MDYIDMPQLDIDREAAKVNDELVRRGVTGAQMTAWWNEERPELGTTATGAWLDRRCGEVWKLLDPYKSN